jgi:hypothetical protein
MMQLDQISRWQSYLRMLAAGIGPAEESVQSWIPRNEVSDAGHAFADGGAHRGRGALRDRPTPPTFFATARGVPK